MDLKLGNISVLTFNQLALIQINIIRYYDSNKKVLVQNSKKGDHFFIRFSYRKINSFMLAKFCL